MVKLHKSKGIIFAADILEKEKLLDTIQEVNDFIEAIKIGNLILYEHGWEIIKEIKKVSILPLIADLKFMDIPDMAKRISKSASVAGADGIMICGPVGQDAIFECKNIFKEGLVFVFTQFTHHSGLITNKMADKYIDLSLSCKCDGIQVPGTLPKRISKIRNTVGNKLIIISCGIGKQGPEIGSAVAAGADYEIIGRSIYSPKELGMTPREAATTAQKIISANIKLI
jgi:orotidine-5'-phosphate decarboxylase